MADATSETELTGRWIIDPTHSRIGFSTRHAMVAKVRGAFNDVQGDVTYDAQSPDDVRVDVTVQMGSVDTRNELRDEHLRGEDFLDVERYPLMTFVSTEIDEVEENEFVVIGELNIRETTRRLSIPLALIGVHADQFGNLRAGLEGSRRINRRDWGITWNTVLDDGGLLVGDKISLEFELSLIKQGDEVLPEPISA